MYRYLFLISVLTLALPSRANEIDKDAIFSIRYSTTDITYATLPVFGVGFANVKGKGKFGAVTTIDYQTFGADWSAHYPSKESQDYHMYLDGSWGVNVMFGAAYGVTDEFYIVPKIGVSYNKLYYANVDNNTDKAAPIVDRGIRKRYDTSYGIDAMYSYKSLTLGVGVSNYYHFLDRETKANLLLGYRF